MQAVLYLAILDNRACEWRISLDMRVDLQYRFGRHQDSLRIWMLEPALSFGQAVRLCERLMKEIDQSRKLLQRPDRLLGHVIRQMEQCGIMLRRADGSMHRKPKLVVCDYAQWQGYRASGNAALVQIQEPQLSALITAMRGRSLLLEEFIQLLEHHGLANAAAEPLAYVQAAYLAGALQLHQGIRITGWRWKLPSWRREPEYRCHRCGGQEDQLVMTDCMDCGGPCPYCEQCLTMGRSRYCSITISSASGAKTDQGIAHAGPDSKQTAAARMKPVEVSLDEYIQPWGLSEIQAEASLQALAFLKGNEFQNRDIISTSNSSKNGQAVMVKGGLRQFLIWAVTGAGKTEMIFPLIQYTVAHGGHVVVATPRRDVVLELKPRLEKAFAPTPVVTLYGGSDQRWDSGTITIATTHQLLRFEQAFELVIIDELDAFPYHNNPMLLHAARKVCKSGGATVLLSATPPRHLQKAVKRRQLPHVKVAARYHRQPLPVPILMNIPSLSQLLKQASLPIKLKHRLMASLARGAQVFVFVPKIQMVEPLTRLLGRLFPDICVEGTSSKDNDRAQKVGDFRSKQVRLLVTTTILERGVTIPKSDVFILDADAPIFDAAALVQMAGRAGRSADDPAGHVVFAGKEKTRAQAEAVSQIKGMNTLARKKGYLREKEEV